MKQHYTNMNPVSMEGPDPFFLKLEVPYGRTSAEAWNLIEQRINLAPEARVVRMSAYRYAIAVAAAVVLLIAAGLVMRYYTAAVLSPAGTQVAHVLPDGSAVQLNAGSKLSYHPLWWRFSRILHLEGEGFFEVLPGKPFEVTSGQGKTAVVGTSFSIYSRSGEYRVTCLTGQVRVSSLSDRKVVIGPDEQASVGPDGNITVMAGSVTHGSVSWLDGRFTFSAAPLRMALDEVERQYAVTILSDSIGDELYTGYFSRDKPVEEVIELICKPFGLTFVKISESIYEIR